MAARVQQLGIDRLFYLGDVYESGTAAEFANNYHPSWGRFKAITSPTPGNHEWDNRAQGYDPYWGALAPQNGGGHYYSYNLAGWHVVSLNSPRGLRLGLAAGRLAQARPRALQRHLHRRLLAPPALERRLAQRRRGHRAALLGAHRARHRPPRRARPQLPALQAAPRHHPVHRGHGRQAAALQHRREGQPPRALRRGLARRPSHGAHAGPRRLAVRRR